MNIPSVDSKFLSGNDVMNRFDVESIFSSNPFLSTQPVEDPPTYNTHQDPLTYNTHQAFMCNSIDSCNSGTLAGHSGLSNPVLTATFCNSSRPNDGHSQGAVPAKHKMIERKRRKDMSALMSILRSLLPDEMIRGKRAVSDQVQEAVNYVNHLQRKVENLSVERDKLKANSDNNAKVSFQGVRLSCNDNSCIRGLPIGGSNQEFPTVKIKAMGSVYQVWTNTFEHQIVYADLLITLEDGGLEVVSAAFSAINNRVYHTIHAKVSDLNIFNIDTIYQKLCRLIRTNDTEDQDSETVEAQT